jgi:hypothetical protein
MKGNRVWAGNEPCRLPSCLSSPSPLAPLIPHASCCLQADSFLKQLVDELVIDHTLAEEEAKVATAVLAESMEALRGLVGRELEDEVGSSHWAALPGCP